jgi:hypothetical protein
MEANNPNPEPPVKPDRKKEKKKNLVKYKTIHNM